MYGLTEITTDLWREGKCERRRVGRREGRKEGRRKGGKEGGEEGEGEGCKVRRDEWMEGRMEV